MRATALIALAAASLLLVVGSVHAQICADADGDGSVSVTDGVKVLRNAAALENACLTARCDVDGSNTIGLADGVNVLRVAADLPFDLRCPVLNANEQQAYGTLEKSGNVAGMLELGINAASASAAAAASVVAAAGGPCPQGGTVTSTAGGATYDACRVGTIVCSGTAAFEGDELVPQLECIDLENDRLFDLGGAVTPSAAGSTTTITGPAIGTQGASTVFQFDYKALALDEDERGGRSAGVIDVGGAFFAGAFEQVEVSFPGRNPETDEPDPGFAKIVGLRSGGGGIIFVFVFDLNLATGKLTPR
jgi:hypothetical protein